MSRDLIDSNYYITSGGKIPVKWTAPEVTMYIYHNDVIKSSYIIYRGRSIYYVLLILCT